MSMKWIYTTPDLEVLLERKRAGNRTVYRCAECHLNSVNPNACPHIRAASGGDSLRAVDLRSAIREGFAGIDRAIDRALAKAVAPAGGPVASLTEQQIRAAFAAALRDGGR